MTKHKQTHHKPHKSAKSKHGKHAGKRDFDLEAFQRTIWRIAYPSSQGSCARNVRIGLEAGLGRKLDGHPLSAADYAGYLKRIGFEEIHGKREQPGDIAVFAAWGTGPAKWGHIAGLTTHGWYSDFKQSSRYGFGSGSPPARVLRW